MKTKNPQNSCPWCIKHVANPLGWRLATRFRVQHSSKNGANVHAVYFSRDSRLSLSLSLSPGAVNNNLRKTCKMSLLEAGNRDRATNLHQRACRQDSER